MNSRKPFFAPAPNPAKFNSTIASQSLFTISGFSKVPASVVRQSKPKRQLQAWSQITVKGTPKIIPNKVLEQLKVDFESKKVITGLILTKKAAILAAPLVATAIWTNTDIDNMQINYSPPQAVVQQVKSNAKDMMCRDFEFG